MHHGCFEEGVAARVLGNPRDSNPYRKALRERPELEGQNGDIMYEHASDWESGWVAGKSARQLGTTWRVAGRHA